MQIHVHQLHELFSVCKSLTDLFPKFIVAVAAWVIAYRLELCKIYVSTSVKDFFIGADIDDFSDVVHLILCRFSIDPEKLAFKTEGKFVDYRSVYEFTFACSESCFLHFLRLVFSAYKTNVVTGNSVLDIGDAYGEGLVEVDVVGRLMF